MHIRNLAVLLSDHNEIAGAQLKPLYFKRFGQELAPGMKLKDALAPAVKAGKLRIETCAGGHMVLHGTCKKDIEVSNQDVQELLHLVRQPLLGGEWKQASTIFGGMTIVAVRGFVSLHQGLFRLRGTGANMEITLASAQENRFRLRGIAAAVMKEAEATKTAEEAADGATAAFLRSIQPLQSELQGQHTCTTVNKRSRSPDRATEQMRHDRVVCERQDQDSGARPNKILNRDSVSHVQEQRVKLADLACLREQKLEKELPMGWRVKHSQSHDRAYYMSPEGEKRWEHPGLVSHKDNSPQQGKGQQQQEDRLPDDLGRCQPHHRKDSNHSPAMIQHANRDSAQGGQQDIDDNHIHAVMTSILEGQRGAAPIAQICVAIQPALDAVKRAVGYFVGWSRRRPRRRSK